MKRFLGVLFTLVLITAVSAVPTLAVSEDTVSVNAPTEVPEGGSFTASVEISEMIRYVYGLSNYYFEVSYDPTVLHLKDVTYGQVWGSTPCIFLWEWLPQGVENSGKIRVGAVVFGTYLAVYSDYLCEMDFDVIGSAGEVSPIALSGGILIDAYDIEIPNLTWVSTVVQVMESAQEPPVADIGGPYSVDEGSALILDGSGSYDPDEAAGDSIISYEWDLDNDGMFDDASGATPTISWATIASLGMAYPADPATGLPNNTIRLRVTDTFGATSIATTTLTIYDNQPFASFTASPNPTAPGQVITFDASDSSHGRPDRSIVLYEWDFDYDGTTFNIDASGVEVTHAYATFGSYTVALRVTDDNSPPKTDTTTTVIDINQGNQPPVADPNGPYIIDQGNDVTLDASGSYDPDEAAGDSIISYEWDLDNDGQFDDATGATPTIPWATTASLGMAYPADPATGLPDNAIRLRVTDTFGVTSTSATTLTIYDNQPEAPTVTTDAASGVSCMVATLNGTVNANGFSTTVTFEYGLTTAYGTIVTADQSPVTGDTGTAVSKTLSGLTTNTTYHYRVVATNAGGTTYGADMTFTTKSGEAASGKAYGKDDAPGQNKEPGEPADGKGDAPGQNKEPGEPADGKAYGNHHALGQNK